jgi:hypothetical protein
MSMIASSGSRTVPMSCAIELMSPLQLDEPFARESHLEVRVEVAIGLLGVAEQPLGLGQLLAQPVGLRRIQRRIGERPADRLQPLIQVAVEKRQVVDVAAGSTVRGQLQVVPAPVDHSADLVALQQADQDARNDQSE